MNSAPISFQIVLAVLTLAYAVFLYRSRLKPKVIRTAALIILTVGTAVNMYGLIIEGLTEGYITIFFRSLFLTIKMFVYDSDLIDMSRGQHTPYFLEVYFFVLYAAMLTSISAIIMLFGKRLMTVFALFFRRRKFRHVFIGMNSRSEMIVSGIDNEEIAFIEFQDDGKRNEMSAGNVIKGIGADEADGGHKSGRNVTVFFAKKKLKPVGEGANVFSVIGLDRLKKLIDSDTAFYILSEDEHQNLDDMMALLSDKDLTDNTIHVCLSREGIARYYKTSVKRTGVHFIYPSSLTVVELMKTPAYHPAMLMKPEQSADGSPTGTVAGAFNALVIGFGETGQAITKFLYEFSSATGADGKPVPTCITVNDERMERLKGQFIFDNPDIGRSGILQFENNGTESSAFWEKLQERLDNLNYVAISLKDDATNLDMACTICMYAMKKRRSGLDNFIIMVRKRYTPAHERTLVDKMNEKAGREVIVCYGEYEKVFVPDMIVSKSRNGINRNATGLADRISAAYTAVSGQSVTTGTESPSFHAKNRSRMELHQFISRANHVASLGVFTCGRYDVSAEALENLARMEHLRYSRYLMAHGYSYAETDDDVFKTSHQICDWTALTEQDRRYHRDMVRAQLEIIREEQEQIIKQ